MIIISALVTLIIIAMILDSFTLIEVVMKVILTLIALVIIWVFKDFFIGLAILVILVAILVYIADKLGCS